MVSTNNKFTTEFLPGLDPKKPLIICGPCSAETEEQVLDTARQLASFGAKVFRAGIWKPRTKPGGFEGVGEKGLPWLKRVKEETGMYVSTEVATKAHVKAALDAGVDLLWIGARTAANPFAMQEIADTLAESGKDVPVLVKNPVNPDLELWIGAIQRIRNAGVTRVGAIHRGFSAYGKHLYRNMPQWHIPIELGRRMPEIPIICDPSHIGGKRELIAPLSQQAYDMGFDGLIIESHCNPDEAWSDASQQITPEVLNLIVNSLVPRNGAKPDSTESLTLLRQEIDRIDNDLVDMLGKRMRICREIGLYKKEHGMKVVQGARYSDMMKSREDLAREMEMSDEFIRRVYAAIHEESVRQQIEVFKK
ncbi:MAG: bifunctional 3-deoxy-7-phosphoheptulonate synthase/chorismate mutase type II [Bacteroidales bacterium]|nr:bifunctional 3-deoxy-7-phosphoheptulonate synthase/chorismate mutase type II [Bacteroidales bacterium]MBD5288846.1 bifunctional 3-deoxy-7-phosphoheptulonate synthase/chorismate mutase type II [Bacteroides sp.]